MACPCTTNTLRLFIRTVTHVDVAKSISPQTPRRRLQNTALRSFTPVRPFHQRNQTSKALSPSRSHLSAFSSSHASSENSTHQDGASQESTGGRESKTSDVANGTESAYAEFSLEAIDTIAAESSSHNWEADLPEEVATYSRRPAKPTQTPDPPVKPTFRRTKVVNTSFALHFSAPRAPLNAPSTDRDAERRNASLESRSDRSSFLKTREEPSEDDKWTPPPPREKWQIDKAALKEKFPDGWKPQKRLSPDALAGIRALHAQMPEKFTTAALATHFEVSAEAIRRILKSKWTPDADEEADRQRRWFNRGKTIYTIHAEKGQKPPKKWRELGIGNGRPEWMLKKRARAPLPALITTARRRERVLDSESDSLADRIL